MIAVIAAFLARLFLVLLFLPFSAFDKCVNFAQAVKQAEQAVPNRGIAIMLLVAGGAAEIFMSLGVLTGVADSACAIVMALYCVATALLFKPFWRQPDFRLIGASQGREVFWDFLKNFAVAGGFLALAFGPTAAGFNAFLAAPLASHHPYAMEAQP